MNKKIDIIAKNIIIDIVEDFKSFFINNYNVKLDFGNHNGLFIKGTGAKTRIKTL